MKILQIENEPWDSGIANYALTLSAELKRRGHVVHVWGRAGSPLLDQAARLDLPSRGLRRPWSSLHILRRETRALGIELINAHTGSAQALAAALAAMRKVAVIRTRGDARPTARHAFARMLAAHTHAFIAANSRIHQELAVAFPKAEVATIFQGIAAGPSAPLPEAPVFGILGRLDPVKGHETLMEAAARLRTAHPRARFLAVGGGSVQRRAALQDRSRDLGLNDIWEFAGFVDDVPARLARCRVAVVASVGSEAVSRAALEWMAAGRALVASSVGCLPDLVEDGVTGFLVAPGDDKALARTLSRFLDDPELAARLGAEARKRFEKRFSLQRFADETEKFYAKILGHLPS